MVEFIWDIYQHGQIQAAKSEASDAKSTVARQRDRIAQLESALSRMALVSQAMWELLRERLKLSDEELLARMGEIDLRDGMKDGRMRPQLVSCPKCGRTMNTRNTRCIYCGTEIEKPHVFQ